MAIKILVTLKFQFLPNQEQKDCKWERNGEEVKKHVTIAKLFFSFELVN